MSKRVCVICHSHKTAAIDAARATAVALSGAGADGRIPPEEKHIGLERMCRDREGCLESDLILAFGGDGGQRRIHHHHALALLGKQSHPLYL